MILITVIVLIIWVCYSNNGNKVSDEHFIKYLRNKQPYNSRRNLKQIGIIHDECIKMWREMEKTAEMLEKQRNNSNMGFYEE